MTAVGVGDYSARQSTSKGDLECDMHRVSPARPAVSGQFAGDILVIKAGEVHGFRCIGDAPLVQLNVHLSPRFIQENL